MSAFVRITDEVDGSRSRHLGAKVHPCGLSRQQIRQTWIDLTGIVLHGVQVTSSLQ
jgi:hypothetical protein